MTAIARTFGPASNDGAPSQAMVEALFAPLLPWRRSKRKAAIAALAARFDREIWQLLRDSCRSERRFEAALKTIAQETLAAAA